MNKLINIEKLDGMCVRIPVDKVVYFEQCKRAVQFDPDKRESEYEQTTVTLVHMSNGDVITATSDALRALSVNWPKA